MSEPKHWRHYATEIWDEIKANDEPYGTEDMRAIDILASALCATHNAAKAPSTGTNEEKT